MSRWMPWAGLAILAIPAAWLRFQLWGACALVLLTVVDAQWVHP